MDSNHAPEPRPEHRAGHRPSEDAGRTVVPVREGVAPAPSAAREVDWSGSRQAATVGRLVEVMGAFDRTAAQAVEALVQALETDAAEATLGVPVEVLLAQTCRQVGFERNTLLKIATTLMRMPATRNAFVQGWISYSQVRGIVTAVRTVDVEGRAEIDGLVGELAVKHADVEADHLLWEVDWLAGRLAADARVERDATPVADNRFRLTPRLDGSGSMYGDYDATHFMPMAESIDDLADRIAARDTADADPAAASAAAGHDPDEDAALTEAHRHAAAMERGRSRRRADALFELVTGKQAATLAPVDPDHGSGRGRRVPSVSLTCHVDTLIDGSAPAWVLSKLTGRMKVTSDVARRWVADGAATRLIAVDDVGQVVGVGRRTNVPPGWLRDAVIARDLHDTSPASTTPARLCDIDHITPWPDGATDVDNLGLVSRRAHTRKTRKQWRLDRHPDGSRTWTVPRSGYTVRQPPPFHLPRPRTSPSDADAGAGGKDPPDPRGP